MLRQIRLLSAVQLCNLFRLNEIRHTKDRKERRRYGMLGLSALILVVVLAVYAGGLAYGFVLMGMGEMVPAYLFAVTSIVIVCFTFLKAGSIIFQPKAYETLIALPVSRAAIVVSRFLTLYVTNLLFGILIMFPGLLVCGAAMRPPVRFYVWGLVGTILLPLLPVTVAVILGAGITAISSRMRHKSIVEALLVIAFAVGIIVFSFSISESPDPELMLTDLASAMNAQIGKMYPPAVWFGQALNRGQSGAFLLFAAGAFLIFAVMIAILQKYFTPICSALNASGAKNNYQMGKLSQQPPLRALWQKELRRYFASGIYVSNTSMGYILMAVFSVALYFMGTGKMEELLQMPGIVSRLLPFLLACIAAIMPTTACSISMEGKWWWIAKTLPVSGRQILDSKILVNLTIAFPFYLVAVVFGILSVSPTILEAIWIAVIPAVYILFTAVAGITTNLAFPVFDWDNETQVVKQSASTMIVTLTGMVSSILPTAILFAAGEKLRGMIFPAVTVILLAVTAVLYRHNNRKMQEGI